MKQDIDLKSGTIPPIWFSFKFTSATEKALLKAPDSTLSAWKSGRIESLWKSGRQSDEHLTYLKILNGIWKMESKKWNLKNGIIPNRICRKTCGNLWTCYMLLWESYDLANLVDHFVDQKCNIRMKLTKQLRSSQDPLLNVVDLTSRWGTNILVSSWVHTNRLLLVNQIVSARIKMAPLFAAAMSWAQGKEPGSGKR